MVHLLFSCFLMRRDLSPLVLSIPDPGSHCAVRPVRGLGIICSDISPLKSWPFLASFVPRSFMTGNLLPVLSLSLINFFFIFRVMSDVFFTYQDGCFSA